MPTLDVIFRKAKVLGATPDDDLEVVAVFPSLPGTGPHDLTVYAHVWQHCRGSLDWYRRYTVPARPAEYAPLLAELRIIYEAEGELMTTIQYRRYNAVHACGGGTSSPGMIDPLAGATDGAGNY